MYVLRRWVVRHAGLMESLYRLFDAVLHIVRPVVRVIGYDRVEKPVAAVERTVKGLLFDCRMCGACLLSVTGMACPMNCPKSMRNGPCGGVRPDGNCEVKTDMPCVWMEAWRGAQRTRLGVIPKDPNPPVENNYIGKSSWLRVVRQEPWPEPLLTNAPHTSTSSAVSRLEKLLREGLFVVTSECAPPDSADPDAVLNHVQYYEGCIDALNVTDAPGAHCHMSSMGVSLLLEKAGWEPVMQMTCRDRNRIAIQGDLLSASALGIRNLLCLTGDGIENGDDPGAKPVFDLDAVSLLDTARRMRDDGVYRSGRELATPPKLFLGAVDNPFVPPFDLRSMRLAKKIEAGAQFVQTQYCYDIEVLKRYMECIREEGLHNRCFILVGVGPLVSPRTARWMRANVPGVYIPDEIIARLEKAQDSKKEGIKICIETIQEIHEIEGISGIHLMAPKREHLIQEIVHASGVLTGRPSTLVSTGEFTCPSQG